MNMNSAGEAVWRERDEKLIGCYRRITEDALMSELSGVV